MALADKTRLRLLNMMRDGEICVGSFTDALGESQPKISRHLAYLRNVGIVGARRDGKWIHYSIRWPDDPGASGLLEAALEWVSDAAGRSPSAPAPHAQMRSSSAQAAAPEAESEIIYVERNIMDSHIAGSEYEAHNELDDFLL
jgi:ArsR family transcriptional regulator